LVVENKDWLNRKDKKSLVKKVPRPGHADLAGVMKYGFDDIQSVIERSSARETAMRTAVGAVTKIFLAEFGTDIIGYTAAIGRVKCSTIKLTPDRIKLMAEKSPVYCPDPEKSPRMCTEIDKAKSAGDTLGGAFEVLVINAPPGLGSYVHWDRKIEGRLSQAIMSIPSVKAVEIGQGIANASRPGSKAHDKITTRDGKLSRSSNRAGGIEGGVTNGQPIIIRGYAKPISSLRTPLPSVNIHTGEKTTAPYVRSDICVVPAIGVIAEAMISWVLADAFIEKFGGDSIPEMHNNLKSFMSGLKNLN
jgi:chorismate synthase